MRTIALTAVATALSISAAMAQNTSPSPSPSSTPPGMTANPPASEPAPPPMPSKGPDFVSAPQTAMLSTNLVGLDVRNGERKDVGKIHDLVVNEDNSITGYVVSVGGFLGMGTHYVVVDPASLAISYDADARVWRATMNATKDQLKAAPEFKYGGRWSASRS